MISNLCFDISAKLWVYRGKGAWYFITIPEEESGQIKFFSGKRIGWGSVRVTAKIGDTVWKTSIFPESKSKTYILPVKAEVRKKEKIGEGDVVQVSLDVIL